MAIITPNQARVARKAMRQSFAEARARIEKARALRAKAAEYTARTGRKDILSLEDAAGELVYTGLYHDDARKQIRFLTTSTVEKYSAMSPNVKARHIRRHGDNS